MSHFFCPDALKRSGRAAPSGATASGLAELKLRCPRKKRRVHKIKTNEGSILLPASQKIALSRPGGYGGVAAPVPIPNTAVKRPSANGTSS